MDEYKQNFLEAPAQFATMDEVRALVSSYFTNLNQPIRMQSKSMESAGFTEATPTTSGNGWRIDAQGNCYFNDGHFRGDITGATGTFSGTVNVGSLNIPDSTTANSAHTNTTGNSWWGCNVADFNADNNNADAYVLNTGNAKFQNIELSGVVVLKDLAAGSVVDGQYVNALSVGKLSAGTIASKAITFAITPGGGDSKIQFGKTDFGQDSTNGLILGFDDSDSDAFKFELTGGKIQTSGSGNRVILDSSDNVLKFLDSANNQVVTLGLTNDANDYHLRIRTFEADNIAIGVTNDSSIAITNRLIWGVVTNASSTGQTARYDNAGSGQCLLLNATGTGAALNLFPVASAPTAVEEGDVYYKENSGLYYIDENLKHNKVNFVNSKEEDTFGFTKSTKTITDANTVSASSVYMVSTSIIIEAHYDSSNGKIRFSKSTDSGATWSAPVDVGTGINTSDKYIYSADGTTIWIAYSNSTNLVVAKSTNGGANWTPANIQTDSMSGGGASLAGITGDTLFVVYYSSTGAAKSSVRFTKSADSGANFSASVGCGQSSTTAEPGAYRVSISMIDTDNAYVAFNYSSAGTDKLCCSRTSNGGTSWTVTNSLDGGTGKSSSISAYTYGGSKAIYAISNNAGTEIKVYKSTGGAFSLVNTYTPPGSNDNASIYTRGLTSFAFTWADIPGANYVMMLGISEDSGANISSEQILASGGGGRPIYTSIHGISNGRMAVAAACDNNGNVQTDNSTAVQVLKISNVSVAPTVPIGGVYVYALAGELKSKDSAGNVTALS